MNWLLPSLLFASATRDEDARVARMTRSLRRDARCRKRYQKTDFEQVYETVADIEKLLGNVNGAPEVTKLEEKSKSLQTLLEKLEKSKKNMEGMKVGEADPGKETIGKIVDAGIAQTDALTEVVKGVQGKVNKTIEDAKNK